MNVAASFVGRGGESGIMEMKFATEREPRIPLRFCMVALFPHVDAMLVCLHVEEWLRG